MSTFNVNSPLWESIMVQLAEAQELKKRVAIAEATVENYKEYCDKMVAQVATMKMNYDRQIAELKARYEGAGPAQARCQAIANAVMDLVEAEEAAESRSVADSGTVSQERRASVVSAVSVDSGSATLKGVLDANFTHTNCEEDFVPAAAICEAVAASLGGVSSRTIGKMMSSLGFKGKVKKVKGKAITVYTGLAPKLEHYRNCYERFI